MYEYLEGRLAAQEPARVVVDVGGVAYDVAVPIGAGFAVRDERVRVWTHLDVREDSQRLFGFPDRAGRELFRLLLCVRGVGPGLALAILSSLPGEALLEAIAAEDPRPLTAIRGVGKKTAEQILLDLRGRAPRPSPPAGVLVPQTGGPVTPLLGDAMRALTSIGYKEKEARRAVERAAERVETDDLELLVRTALQE